MSDWQAGDLALCILDDWVAEQVVDSPQVRVGHIYNVAAVHFFYGLAYLEFVELERSGYEASGFVKVTPGSEITGKEVEAKRPVKVPA